MGPSVQEIALVHSSITPTVNTHSCHLVIAERSFVSPPDNCVARNGGRRDNLQSMSVPEPLALPCTYFARNHVSIINLPSIAKTSLHCCAS